MTRRKFAKAVSVGAAAAAVVAPALRAQAPPPVKALVFDTFGTVVDWRGSIIAEGMAWSKAKGVTVDWPRFADRWREVHSSGNGEGSQAGVSSRGPNSMTLHRADLRRTRHRVWNYEA